jgi:hypothetical protein
VELNRVVAIEAEEVKSAGPQMLLAIYKDRVDRAGRHSVTAVHALDPAGLPPVKPVIGSHPDSAFMILAQRPDVTIRKAVRFGPQVERPVAIADYASAFGSDPQSAVGGGKKAEDAVLMDGRRVIAVEDHELSAIETNQATGRADPQEVIRRLGERLDGFFRQSIFGMPNAPRIAGQGAIERAYR